MDKSSNFQHSKVTAVNCFGCDGGDCFLIKGNGANILVDSGFAFSAEEAVKKIKTQLKGETLDYILLTHSHYDHAMGVPMIKKEFPFVKVVASEYCAYIFSKQSAKSRMYETDCKSAKYYGKKESPDMTDLLGVDIVVKDGEYLTIGEHEVKAVALPGHTKCCMGFYFTKEKFIVSCETIGISGKDMDVFPGCLIGYKQSLDSIKKVIELKPEQLLIPHSGIIYNEDVEKNLANSLKVIKECRDLIIQAHKNGADFDKIVEIYKERYYSDEIKKIYPEHALMANISAQIPMFINEFENEGE